MIRFTALVLTVLTGFCGLVYEVAWQKYLATLLGSHSEATAAVLAIFLGGLSAGYAGFGALTRRLVASARRERRPARLLFVYGLVEGGIGVYALLFPTLFSIAQHVSLLVPAGHPGLGFAFDVALSALLIGPPAVLMGGTIPMLTLALAGDLEQSTRVHAWVYGANTAGAFAGALAAAFWLIPAHGLDGTLYAMAFANLVAGTAFVVLDRRAQRVAPDFGEETIQREPPRFAAYAAVALLAGFAMMTLQATLNRVAALAFGSSPFTFAMIVAVFVACIALGSLAVSALPRIPARLLDITQWILVALLIGLYFQVPYAPYWAHVLRALLTSNEGAFYLHQLLVFGALFAVLALPVGLSGALLPLIFDRLRREVGDLGSVAGRLYALNTVGSLLGALLGGYILFFWLDLHHIYRIAVAAIVAGVGLLSWIASRRSAAHAECFVVALVCLGLLALPAWDPARLVVGLYRQREAIPLTFLGAGEFEGLADEIVFYDDDPNSTVAVVRKERDGKLDHSILVNGKSDGSVIGDAITVNLLALVPALFAESTQRCFVIGLGTGVSAGALAALEGTDSVDVAEISRGVIAAAPIFDYANQGVSQNAKIRLHPGDAYRTLLKTEGSYDVIVSEPSNPWVSGIEMLFSREFLEAGRSRLAPGGVYAQWMHLYETDARTLELVLRTYASVFPRVAVWFTQETDVLLLGFNDPERALDVTALEAKFARRDFAAGFARAHIGRFPALLAHELLPIGTLGSVATAGEIHTLRHPILSDRAARAFFRGGVADLPRPLDPASRAAGAANSLVRRHAGVAAREPLPESVLEPALIETCGHERTNECHALSASWLHDYPDSQRRRQTAAQLRRGINQIPLPSEDEISRTAWLFGNEAIDNAPADATVPPERAARLTLRFLNYYYHAVPFDSGVIEFMWNHCYGEPCEEGGSSAAEKLGFDYRPIARWRSARRTPQG